MNEQLVQKELERANDRLEALARHIVVQPQGTGVCAQGLREVYRRLETVRRSRSLLASRAFAQLLDEMRARKARLAQLLDAAARFYLGAAACTTPESETYTAEGRIERIAPPHSLKIDA